MFCNKMILGRYFRSYLYIYEYKRITIIDEIVLKTKYLSIASVNDPL